MRSRNLQSLERNQACAARQRRRRTDEWLSVKFANISFFVADRLSDWPPLVRHTRSQEVETIAKTVASWLAIPSPVVGESPIYSRMAKGSGMAPAD